MCPYEVELFSDRNELAQRIAKLDMFLVTPLFACPETRIKTPACQAPPHEGVSVGAGQPDRPVQPSSLAPCCGCRVLRPNQLPADKFTGNSQFGSRLGSPT